MKADSDSLAGPDPGEKKQAPVGSAANAGVEPPSHLDEVAAFASHYGLQFNRLYLLVRALTHRSYVNEHPEALLDNERLEFLGDAVLDFLVAAWLYRTSPEFDEGRMTRYRAALVGNEQLAEFARRLDLGALLLLGRGEEENGGRDRSPLLGSTFEAVVGAIYLDQGLDAASGLVTPLLESVVDKILEEGREIDAKSLLQEWAQAQGLGTPIYRKIEESGPDHAKTFVMEVIISDKVYGRSQGRSKQAAAKAAAQVALAELGLI